MNRVLPILIAILLVVPALSRAGKGPGPNNPGGTAECSLQQQLAELPEQHLGNRELSDLMFMREEEKLARDVYLSLYEQWDLAIFRQIARAESQHMALALILVEKYGVEDPVGDNALGVFTNPALQALYEKLAASGAESVESALLVGAAIEDLDLRDLVRSVERANNEDLDLLYQNLMKGSRNHLRAFTRVLGRYGIGYEPVYLALDEFLEIVESPREKGVVDASGEPLCGGGQR